MIRTELRTVCAAALAGLFFAGLAAAESGRWPPPLCTDTQFDLHSRDGIPALVSSANRPPRISGTPGTRILADNDYVFLPDASDPDGDRLEFFIANQPAWTEFNREWGSLSGIPTEADTGVYPGISISVSDGRSAPVSLPPFTITVTGRDGRKPATAALRVQRPADPLYNGIPLSTWIRSLDSSDISERRRALQVMTAMGPEASAAVPVLIAILQRPVENPLVRAGSATALGRVGRGAREAVPALIRYLMEGGALNVEAAAEALGKIGEPAAVPFLARYLERSEPAIARKVATALGEIGPAAFEAVPLLVKSMQKGNEQAAEALGRIGDPASVPALTAALSDWRIAYGAASALGAIGAEDARVVPALVRAVGSSAPEPVRVRVIEVLGSFGIRAQEAIPALVGLLKGSHPAAVRAAAAQALMNISTEKEGGLPVLIWALGDAPDPAVRRWAAEFIGRLGPSAIDAIPALLKATAEPDSGVRAEAERSLRKLQGRMAGKPLPGSDRLASGK